MVQISVEGYIENNRDSGLSAPEYIVSVLSLAFKAPEYLVLTVNPYISIVFC
jgi:hypothetical protein